MYNLLNYNDQFNKDLNKISARIIASIHKMLILSGAESQILLQYVKLLQNNP